MTSPLSFEQFKNNPITAIAFIAILAVGYLFNEITTSHEKQLENQGKVDKKKYTTCRLKKRITSRYTNKKACIYQGGNKTYELMIESWCPKKYKCIYNPNGTEPDIDQVMESLRSIGKK